MAEAYARFFKPYLAQLITVLAQVATSDMIFRDMNKKIQHLAAQVICLIAEGAPFMARSMPGNRFVLTALETTFKLIMDQPDDPEWVLRDDEEDDDK